MAQEDIDNRWALYEQLVDIDRIHYDEEDDTE